MGFIVILILIPLIGGAYLTIRKAKSLRRLEEQAGGERHQHVARHVRGGRAVQGVAENGGSDQAEGGHEADDQ